jgi:predicted nucleotidyltransferase
MKKNIETILAELSSILRKNLGNNIKIFLYGSYARNDQSPDSDIDILVIVDSLTKEQRNNCKNFTCL